MKWKEGHPRGMSGKHHTEASKRKMSRAHKGKVFSEATRLKMSEVQKGHPNYRKGQPGPMKGKHRTEETKLKISKALVGRKRSKETIKKILRRRIPSSLEEKFQGIIDKHNLPYKYVGDGSFFIEKRNPDFINTNSEKVAIEVYARYYKKRQKVSIEEWKEGRRKIFEEYGWSIIYFDETEVNEETILSKLGD